MGIRRAGLHSTAIPRRMPISTARRRTMAGHGPSRTRSHAHRGAKDSRPRSRPAAGTLSHRSATRPAPRPVHPQRQNGSRRMVRAVHVPSRRPPPLGLRLAARRGLHSRRGQGNDPAETPGGAIRGQGRCWLSRQHGLRGRVVRGVGKCRRLVPTQPGRQDLPSRQSDGQDREQQKACQAQTPRQVPRGRGGATRAATMIHAMPSTTVPLIAASKRFGSHQAAACDHQCPATI